MHNRIVVGVDFSATAHAAVLQALFMARVSGAELHLVHVIDVFGQNPLVEVLRSAVDEAELKRRLLDESDRLMREFAADIDFGDVKTHFDHVRAPNVVSALVAYVHERKADLLALGSRGRRGLKRLFLGSVVTRYLHICPVPTLIVKLDKAESIRDPIDRLLVPLDLSATSMQALREARRLAVEYQAHMDVLHVVEPYAFPVSLTGIRKIEDLVPTIRADVQADLEGLISRLEGGYVPYRVHVMEGASAETISKAADELNSDLIVLSKRRTSSPDRLTSGGTIEKVARIAEVPLYVVPTAADGAEADAASEAVRATEG